MNRRSERRVIALGACLLTASLFVGCERNAPAPAAAGAPQAKADSQAPAPPDVPSADPSGMSQHRAAPPMPEGVALGAFVAGDPIAEAATGKLTIDDMAIHGDNGASFVTERVAIVRGNDSFNANGRYADAMMIVPEQPVELRHVTEQTRPAKTPGGAFCGTSDTAYFALAKVVEGDTDVIKLMALQGTSLPAASAADVKLCAVTHYSAATK